MRPTMQVYDQTEDDGPAEKVIVWAFIVIFCLLFWAAVIWIVL